MQNRLKALITRSLFFTPIAVAYDAVSVAHATTSAPQATTLLARGGAVDAKCGYLSPDDHTELQDYVARAEVGLAKTQGVKTAMKAVRNGKAMAEAIPCDSQSREMVVQTIDAARQAVRRVDARIATASVERKRTGNLPQPSVAGLESYKALTAAYYTERRCQHLTYDQATRFWKAVVARHEAAVRAHGPGAVGRVKRQAIRQSETGPGCGFRTVRLVREAYRSIR